MLLYLHRNSGDDWRPTWNTKPDVIVSPPLCKACWLVLILGDILPS